MDNPYRVSLSSKSAQPPYGYNKVTFEVSPEFVESRTVNYSSIDPVHMPGNIYVYKNTQARTFSISGAKLLSRTPDEAENTLTKLWMLRGWTMPRFGINSSTASGSPAGQAKQQAGFGKGPQNPSSLFTDQAILQPASTGELLGSPPEVLYLSAYSPSSGASASSGAIDTTTPASSSTPGITPGFPQPAPIVATASVQSTSFNNIKRIPVVITSLSIPFPTDVDYIISSVSKMPIPLIMSVDVSLLEAHSAQEYEQFSLDKYKQGNLTGF